MRSNLINDGGPDLDACPRLTTTLRPNLITALATNSLGDLVPKLSLDGDNLERIGASRIDGRRSRFSAGPGRIGGDVSFFMARGSPPSTPLQFKCFLYSSEIGKGCPWSFSRRFDCRRHEKTHLTGDALVEELHYCPLGTGCHADFKNLQLSNLRTHIRAVHHDIQHLICQDCMPFVLTADPAAFNRHKIEKHSDLQPVLHTIHNPTPPAMPVPFPQALPQPSTSKITLAPLSTLIRHPPAPLLPPPCSIIIRAKLPLPENRRLKPIVPRRRHDWHVAPTRPYIARYLNTVPKLRDFLRDACGVELRPPRTRRHLPSPVSSSMTGSGSVSTSPSASQSTPPTRNATISPPPLQWVGSLTVPEPIMDTNYSRFRFVGGNVISMRLDSRVLPAP
ncbi:uncharacterized protein BT62DRAFT_1011248 [Guyanagaster necrorhizus]|uniref:Uncharacterized protein n=1 Tax=Guyanagaster necrorhizus TaxID=856835 RepID=A0A9P8ANA4_9AGAR|nr:uncharacterized protein BT62DRAFT_1011248 [Guyanagaster necrorhizus MCA 3950]KAG7441680.1 hypothetical protein BT62DRAFT_1011248 [Guyanagaster necrorhizus MCA 3950]